MQGEPAMADRAALIAEKEAFAERLAEAIRTQSVEGLMALLPSLDEYHTVQDLPPEATATDGLVARIRALLGFSHDHRSWRKVQRTQAEAFLSDCNERWQDFSAYIDGFSAHESSASGFSEAVALPETRAEFIAVNTVSVSGPPIELENGDIATLGVQMDHSFFLNGKLLANNLMASRCHVFIDNGARIARQLETLGFKPLSKDEYEQRMAGETWPHTSALAHWNFWMIHHGDLILDPDQVELLRGSILIDGDLTVNGILQFEDIDHVHVLGNIRAEAVYIASYYFYVSGTIIADTWVHLGDTRGAPAQIGAIEAPLFTNSTDALYVPDTNTDQVQVVDDYEGHNKGDLREAVRPEFLWEDGSVGLFAEDAIKALKAGKEVFQPGFLNND
jgi:hypothetical protein